MTGYLLVKIVYHIIYYSYLTSIFQEAILDENMHVAKQHEAVVECYKERFVGRKNLIKECMKHINEKTANIIVLNGKPGSGKSALLVSGWFDHSEKSVHWQAFSLNQAFICLW